MRDARETLPQGLVVQRPPGSRWLRGSVGCTCRDRSLSRPRPPGDDCVEESGVHEGGALTVLTSTSGQAMAARKSRGSMYGSHTVFTSMSELAAAARRNRRLLK